jgi:hypothetical protein
MHILVITKRLLSVRESKRRFLMGGAVTLLQEAYRCYVAVETGAMISDSWGQSQASDVANVGLRR